MFIKWTQQDRNMYSYHQTKEKWNYCKRKDNTSFINHFVFQFSFKCDLNQLGALKLFSDRKKI